MSKKQRFLKIWEQRIMGLGLVLISTIAAKLSYIEHLDSYDATVALLLVPLGAYMFLTNKLLID